MHFGLERYQDQAYLVLEDIQGVPMNRLVAVPPDPGQILPLAIQSADILGRIHDHGFVHRDIKPANLWVGPGGEVTVIDLRSAILMDAIDHASPALEGTLAYMAPEQTGRMDLRVDGRADLYALGVTLYELLTGERPFDQGDPVALIHAHLTQIPLPPHEHTDVSLVLSQIVMTLLAKNPEDRYQTAYGLRSDLENCLDMWLTQGDLDPSFRPGDGDRPATLQIPDRLYGREEELSRLREALDQATVGRGTCVIVSGASGVGKSALVMALCDHVLSVGGRCLSGKCDQFLRDRPYGALGQALETLLEDLEADPEVFETVQTWAQQAVSAEIPALVGGDPPAAVPGGGSPRTAPAPLQVFVGSTGAISAHPAEWPRR